MQLKKGYIGYSGLINLLGYVGCGICNNSGCNVSEIVKDIQFYDFKLRHKTLTLNDLNFSH